MSENDTLLAPAPALARKDERLIDKAELLSMVPYTIQHIYRLEKFGRFPRRVRLGTNRVAWVHTEILAWMASCMAARHAAPQHQDERRKAP